MTVRVDDFGRAPDGSPVHRFTLINARGSAAEVTDFGATLLGLWMPDRDGVLGDVVLGFDELGPYTGEHPYFGSTVGRYANRIAGGRFSLDGRDYELARNDPPNHLHGGPHGFHHRVWSTEGRAGDGSSVRFTLRSADGDEGYPGDLSVAVTYTLTDLDELRLEYEATTTQATIVNLTHHSYFNLAGGGDVLAHELAVFAACFVPIDPTGIPIEEPRLTLGTPMDFLSPTAIGARLGDDDAQLRAGQGYDHCWVFDRPSGDLRLAATVASLESGRVMDVLTTEPGLQVYAGNRLDGAIVGKGGRRYPRHAGLCLEAQHLPDSPHRPTFPSTVLRSGERYQQSTAYRFSLCQ